MKSVTHFFNIIKFLLKQVTILFLATIFLWLNMAGMKVLDDLYNEYANLPYGIVFYMLSYSVFMIFICVASLFTKINKNKIFSKVCMSFLIVTFFINWFIISFFWGIQPLKNSLALIQQHTPVIIFGIFIIALINISKSKRR